MKKRELSITVTPQQGLPHVIVEGYVDSWHAQTLEDVVESFIEQEAEAISIDISEARFSGIESISSLIRSIRIASCDMRLALVAGDSTAAILQQANLGPEIVVRTPEEVNSPRRPAEYYSSRFVPKKSTFDELPLAA